MLVSLRVCLFYFSVKLQEKFPHFYSNQQVHLLPEELCVVAGRRVYRCAWQLLRGWLLASTCATTRQRARGDCESECLTCYQATARPARPPTDGW